MSDGTEGAAKAERAFRFIRGESASEGRFTWPEGGEQVRKQLGEALNARNVAFLLGAGCSSFLSDEREVGIPTMGPLAKDFTEERGEDSTCYPTAAERKLVGCRVTWSFAKLAVPVCHDY